MKVLMIFPRRLLHGRGRRLPRLRGQRRSRCRAKLLAQKGKAFSIKHPRTPEGSGTLLRSWAKLRFNKPNKPRTGKSGLDEAKP